jgi:hemolysin activation/secretion protein
MARAASDDPAPVQRFDILEYRIEGNTVLSNLAIERAVYPFLGPDRGIDAVEQARSALEAAYQKTGYLTVLVDIPEQKVAGGIVLLRVVEGKLSRVRVTGNRYYSAGRILTRVDELQEGQVPDFGRVQAQLGTLGRAQDRKITPVLRPGPTPGTVEAELKVEDANPLHGSVELNNRQTPNTEPLRLSTFIRYDNLWQREHSASFQFLTAPEDPRSLRVFSLSYVMPVGKAGDALALYAVSSNSSVTALGATNVIGKGVISGARYVVALPPGNDLFHTFTFGIDSKNFEESQRLGSDTTETPISYVPVSGEYRATFGSQARTSTASMGLYTAPRGLFGNNNEEFARKRFGARPNYLYARGDWRTEQQLTPRTSVFARFSGQLSDQPLISNEQFAAGGAETVRGYLEVEALADNGAILGLELRGNLKSTPSDTWGRVLAVAFADAARLRVSEPLRGQQDRFELYSTGVGLRFQGAQYWTAMLDIAVPLTDGPTTRRGDPRAHVRVEGRF